MARIGTCTSCNEQVTLPDAVDRDARVRCPICNVQYDLRDVEEDTFDAEEGPDLPPRLALLASSPDTPNDETPEADSVEIETGPPDEEEEETGEAEASREEEAAETPAEADSGDETATETDESDREETPGEGAEPEDEAEGDREEAEGAAEEETPAATEEAEETPLLRVRCPTCEAEHRLDEMIITNTDEPLGADVVAAVVRALSPRATAEEGRGGLAGLDVWAKSEAMPQIDLGGGGAATAHDAAAFDFGKKGKGESDAEESVMDGMARRREARKGGWRTLVGPVLGGLAGLVIAYYLLNFIRGESGNFLNIPLPGVAHTYKYSPGWFPSFLKPAGDEDDASTAEGEAYDFESLEIPALPVPTDEEPAAAPPVAEGGPEAAEPDEGSSQDEENKGGQKTKTFPEGYVGLVDPPSYTADELREALEAAQASVEGAKGKITEEVYGSLCRLAEVATFTGGKRGDRLAAQKPAIRELLGEISRTAANLDKIGMAAGALCAGGERGRNGVVLAGKVLKTVSEGKAHGAQVQLNARGLTILVAGDRPLEAEAEDNVLILGSIVDRPAENLVGFATQQPIAVWAGMTVKVP